MLVRVYIGTSIRTYVRTYVCAYVRMYVGVYVRTCVCYVMLCCVVLCCYVMFCYVRTYVCLFIHAFYFNPFSPMLTVPLILKPTFENPKSGNTTFKIANTKPILKYVFSCQSNPIRGTREYVSFTRAVLQSCDFRAGAAGVRFSENEPGTP